MNNIQEATNKNTMKDTLKCDQRKEKSYQHYFLSAFLKVREKKQNEVSPKGGRKYNYPNTSVLISASTDTFSGMEPMGIFFFKRKHLTFLKAKGVRGSGGTNPNNHIFMLL